MVALTGLQPVKPPSLNRQAVAIRYKVTGRIFNKNGESNLKLVLQTGLPPVNR
jgi:hypothetical protein